MINRDDEWFHIAKEVATQALCLDAKCGAIIVSKHGEVIGKGYNAPPCDDVTRRKCLDDRTLYDRNKKPRFDLTCCMHAEWRAILDACRHSPDTLQGATLYFVRVDEEGNIRPSREPFCTVCSRMALDVGIATFVLYRAHGAKHYDTVDYNDRSYAYHKK